LFDSTLKDPGNIMQLPLRTFFSAILFCTFGFTQNVQSAETAYPAELDLKEFVEIALRHNPRVHEARNEIWAAEGRSTQATSAYLPQLSASGRASRVHIKDLTPVDEDNVLSGALTGDQLIFDFGKTTGSMSAASSQVDAARAYLNSVGSDLVFAVKAGYYNVLAKHYLIQVARDQVISYQKHYERAFEYYKAGVKSKIDVTNAEVELENSKLLLLQSQFGLKSARVNLEKIIGVSPNNGDYLVKPTGQKLTEFSNLIAEIPGSLEELLQKASLQRPDLVQAKKEIESSESQLISTQGGYWPEIGLNGSYNSYETDLNTLQDQWQVGIGVNWQFFSGFRTNGEVAEAKSNMRASRARLRGVELNSIQEVTDSYHLAQEKRDSVFLADKIMKLAAENLSLADERYKTGLGDMIEFNDAQLRVTKARNNLVITFFDYNTALASLENSIGYFPDMIIPETEQL
jgi:outer membrane protein